MYTTHVQFDSAEADKTCGVKGWSKWTRKWLPIIKNGDLSCSRDDLKDLFNGIAKRHGFEKIGIGGKIRLQQQRAQINKQLGNCPASVDKNGEPVAAGHECREKYNKELELNKIAQQNFGQEQRTIQSNIEKWKKKGGWKKALAWYVKVGDTVFGGQGAAKLVQIFLDYVNRHLKREHDKYYLQAALIRFVSDVLIPRAEASLCGIGRPNSNKLWTSWWSGVKNYAGIDA